MRNDALSCSAKCNVNKTAKNEVQDHRHKESETNHNASHYQHVIRSPMEKYYLILYMITNTKNLKHTTMRAITNM